MTNPDNIVRVRARNGGRASVYEANALAQAFTQGLVSGNGVIQNTSADMNVLVGGSTANPDVVLAENPSGYRVALDIVGQQAVVITAPASNSRISSIVAYTDDLSLATTEDNTTGSPSSCGLIVVNGNTSGSPTPPDDATIRAAITADGATGSQASYAVVANVTVSSATTTITDSLIDQQNSTLVAEKISDGDITSDKIAAGAVTGEKLGITGEDIPLIFTVPNLFSQTETGKIFKFGKIGIITYNGTTGLSFGPGNLDHLQVSYDFTGMTNVYGGSLVYSQNNAPGCTMHFVRFFQGLVDAYLDTPSFENVDASLIIIVGLS